jgi:hypothetical protein
MDSFFSTFDAVYVFPEIRLKLVQKYVQRVTFTRRTHPPFARNCARVNGLPRSTDARRYIRKL